MSLLAHGDRSSSSLTAACGYLIPHSTKATRRPIQSSSTSFFNQFSHYPVRGGKRGLGGEGVALSHERGPAVLCVAKPCCDVDGRFILCILKIFVPSSVSAADVTGTLTLTGTRATLYRANASLLKWFVRDLSNQKAFFCTHFFKQKFESKLVSFLFPYLCLGTLIFI